jgi:hypothetical protein
MRGRMAGFGWVVLQWPSGDEDMKVEGHFQQEWLLARRRDNYSSRARRCFASSVILEWLFPFVCESSQQHPHVSSNEL